MNSSGSKGQARQGFNGRSGRRGREASASTRSRWQQRRNSGSSSQSRGPSEPGLPPNDAGALSELIASLKDKPTVVGLPSGSTLEGVIVSYDAEGPLAFDFAVDGNRSNIRKFSADEAAYLSFTSPPPAPASSALASAPTGPAASLRGTPPTGPASGASSGSASAGKFRTDAAISGAGNVVERKLQKWEDTDVDGLADSLGSLDTMSHEGPWDQFAVNKQRFGVESTFDERYYTTEIDSSHPEYEERRRKAERLAKEILNDQTTNVHLAEERNQQVDDSGIDEEDKYSGVDRGNGTFISKEARAAEANPQYYDRERADRQSDLAQFNQAYQLRGSPQPGPIPPGMVPPMMMPVGIPPPIVGSPGPGMAPPSISPSPPAKKKSSKPFSFASAAKASSFKPISGAAKQPSLSPVAPGTSIPIPKSSPTPPVAKPRRTLDGAFEYFDHYKSKNEEPARPFTTPPSWDSHSGPSYKDQFSVMAMPMAVPTVPYGFYPGYMPPPMFVYDK
ncbi:hypothetical protein B9G98_01922 [Wickerhamiella sorbophila]|uniref:LsmAD domain-containing protein n=1 Tax=Wickerhamiella sorbophila TaxID=45607 RepID=A0A2T0FH27_9ASCO|nr:hypothetical protein B9G98_01922 [Wickerhamiella sorbophila]PRT54302.1 hypothetical protein B9G98_01922 [Wickerhamiella sorbophila]